MKALIPVHLLGLALAGSLVAAPASQGPALVVEASGQATECAVYYRQQKIMVYEYNPQRYKPYVKELYTLKGDNILQDAPADHLHHHALMYGIRVNGLNFWEETAGSGVQKPVKWLKQETGAKADGSPQVVLSHLVHWVNPQEAFLADTMPAALLIEQRTLTVWVNEARDEVALHWKSLFQVGPKTNQVTLSGASYHGLGMRFLNELDPLAVHFNPTGKPDLSDNKQDVTRHKWASVSFDKPGKPATVVLFGHPSNARGDAWFFTMRTPFAYLSATQGLDKEPLIYRSGDGFELNYLVTLYPDLKSPEAIGKRSQQWESSLAQAAP
jgi:hypothetical protein